MLRVASGNTKIAHRKGVAVAAANFKAYLHLRVADGHARQSILRYVPPVVGRIAVAGHRLQLIQPRLCFLPARFAICDSSSSKKGDKIDQGGEE